MCFKSAQRVLKMCVCVCVCVCVCTMSPFPDATPEGMVQVSSSLFPTHVRPKILFIYIYIWLPRVLTAAHGIFRGSTQTLSCSVGSSSLTRDQTSAPCIGSAQS